MITAHADHVGSLLRPPELLAAREAHARGELSDAAFKRVEDRAVADVVDLQEQAGCPVVTDGEFRRESFQSALTDAVDGVDGVTIDAWLWGDWHSEAVGDQSTQRPPDMAVVRPLRRRRQMAAEDFTFLRSQTERIAKITLPSPSLYANLWTPERSREAYPTLDDFLLAVVDVLTDEVRELQRLGCTYIQLDAPHYPLLIDPTWQAFYTSRGWDLDRWLSYGLELDNAVIGAAPGVTFGFHLCRGNQGSRWLVAGGYDAIAKPVFGTIRAHRLLLEYDDERSGGFDPLALVRDEAMVVLGLVTTKTARQETEQELSARVRDAGRLIPLERLAIGTQCGFSTSVVGNAISVDDERRKLTTINNTAERIWGVG
jgi:5-methyltetrahydropteroyltriglutamate--homocysteine methyltransferase